MSGRLAHLAIGKTELIERLGIHQPLFALLDAARDTRILQLLIESGAPYASLYEGKSADTLAAFAPYIVDLGSSPALLSTILEQGWGRSWGLFLSSKHPLADVRTHLRRFLMVKLPGGEQVYFRFYDPRVLRVFMLGINSEERAMFFGPIDCFLLEDEQAANVQVLRAAESQH